MGMIEVEIHYISEEHSWFAVGFSDHGDAKSSDYCVLWIDWRLTVHFDVIIKSLCLN